MDKRAVLKEALILYLGHQEMTASGFSDYGDADKARIKAEIAEELLNAA